MKITLEIPDRVYKILKDFSSENERSIDTMVYKAIEELIVDINLAKEVLREQSDGENTIPFETVLKEAGMEENLLENELDFDT